MNFHMADIFIVAVILYFLVRGYSSGFLLCMLSLVMLVVSLFVATLYSTQCTEYVKSTLFFLPEQTVQVLSFILLFVIVFTVLNWVSKVTKIINKLPLIGNLNQSLGALFGFVKGLLVISLVCFVINFQTSQEDLKKFVSGAKLYPYVSEIAPSVFNSLSMLVPSAKEFYYEFNEPIKKQMDEHINSL